MSNSVPVSNFVSGAGLVSVDIDALKHLADAMDMYAHMVGFNFSTLIYGTDYLDEFWQGSAAERVRQELYDLRFYVKEVVQLAEELRQSLLAEADAYSQASDTSLFKG
jgi:uncharacterized protein YukE